MRRKLIIILLIITIVFILPLLFSYILQSNLGVIPGLDENGRPIQPNKTSYEQIDREYANNLDTLNLN